MSWFLNSLPSATGVAFHPSGKPRVLESIGDHFLKSIVTGLKLGQKFHATGDNLDLKIISGQLRKDKQSTDLHLFASNFYQHRIDFSDLDDEKPKCKVDEISLDTFRPNLSELKTYHRTSKILVGRILVEFFPYFEMFKKILPKHIQHRFSHHTKQKTNIISMPIIDANETEYPEVIKLLRVMEGWVCEAHYEAGLLDELPVVENPEPKEGPANPGQTHAHVVFSEDDPMKKMKVMLAGDQLTRQRLAGARDLMSDSATPCDRFDHLAPFRCCMWHCKASLLQYCYRLLYSAESLAEVGSLKFFRERYNRKNVTPNKVLDSYEGCEEMFISVGKAYIAQAFLQHFGMVDLDGAPTKHMFDGDITKATDEQLQRYFDHVIGLFVDEFVLQKAPYVNVQQDFVRNYGLNMIYFTVLLLQMKDTAREGDGDRNLINQKILLSIFKSVNTYAKYAKEMFVAIAQLECLLPPRLSEELKWSNFVNWLGGEGKNMEDDLCQEITNRLGKEMIRNMGANKTMKSISRAMKPVSGIKVIMENYDEETNLETKSRKRTKQSALEEEKEMVKDLNSVNVFDHVTNRSHKSFPTIKRLPHQYIKPDEMNKWLLANLKEFPPTESMDL